MRKFLLVLLGLMVTTAVAQNVKPWTRHVKPATGQAILELQEIDNAIVADTDRVLTTQTTSSSVTTTVTSFTAQPDVPRNLTITPTDTTADVAAGTVVVTGTNILNDVITENFTFSANASTATVGGSAFKTVTQIVFHVQDGSGATFIVGVADRLGLSKCMAGSFIVQTMFDNAKETTFPTVGFDVDEIEKNYVDIDGTLDGSKDLDILFIQNFGCF